MGGTGLFKVLLALQCLNGVEMGLKFDVDVSTGVIHKDTSDI